MIPRSERFDVVVVPDFSGKGTVTFEARTLYFLASWIESSGVCGEIPLHLACIGEPPPRVRTLAERARAVISVHPPAPADLGIYANKLRGFDAPLETGRILLVDVDTIIVSELTDLVGVMPPDAIGTTPSHYALLLPEMWTEYYARLGQQPPTARMADFHLTLDIRRDASIFPSFNGGVVLSPTAVGLRQRWEDHLRILNEFKERWAPTLKANNKLWGDEPALTSAIYSLEQQGAKVVELPETYNGRWRHLYRRAPRLRDFKIFHMTSSFGHGTRLAEKLDPGRFAYERKLVRRYGKRWLRHSDSYVKDAVRYLLPASLELVELQLRLRALHRKYLRELL